MARNMNEDGSTDLSLNEDGSNNERGQQLREPLPRNV